MLSLSLAQCNNQSKDMIPSSDNTYTVLNVKPEMDGATVTLSDSKGGKYQTVISIPNGNWIDLEKGDEVLVTYEEFLEMDPALMIGSKITKLEKTAGLSSQLRLVESNLAIGDPVEIKFQVTNSSSEAITFLPWQTPLEERLTANCLKVVFNGEELPYMGMMVKRRPPTEEDMITLKPGETTDATIDIADSYDFSRAGKYTIQYFERYMAKVPASNTVELSIK